MRTDIKYFFGLLLFISNVCFSQNKKIDSLLNVIKVSKNDTVLMHCSNNISWEYCLVGEYQQAIYYGMKGDSLARVNKNQRALAIACNNVGYTYHKLGKSDLAIKFHIESLKIRETLKDEPGMAISYNNIGLVYENKKNYAKAIENHEASLKIKTKLKNKKGIASSYNNLGNIYCEMGEYDQALTNFEKALEIRLEMKDKKGIANCHNNIGIILDRQGKYNDAINNYKLSIQIKEQLKDRYGIGTSSVNLGVSYMHLGNNVEAKKNLYKAYLIADSIGALDLLAESCSALSQVDSALQDYKEAYYYQKKYKQYTDSLFNQESNKKIAEIQTFYETEKKDKQIEVLNLEGEVRKREKTILVYITCFIAVFLLLTIYFYFVKRRDNKLLRIQKQEIIERTELLNAQAKEIATHQSQMNPHFIFNALNSLQLTILKNDRDKSVEQLNTLSKLMRLTLDNSEKEWISLETEIDYLRKYVDFELNRFELKFNFIVEVDKMLDLENTGIPPMLLQPIIENSIKHANLSEIKKGEIRLCMKTLANTLQIIISDNGSGRKNTLHDHQSKAIGIIIKRINKLGDGGIEKPYSIIDLKDEAGKGIGTETKLVIPLYEFN